MEVSKLNKAIVKDNKAYCSKCNERDYRIIDYSNREDGSVKFKVRCNKCGTEFYYYKTLYIGQEKVFVEVEKVRKQSNMGGGEFELDPDNLDKQIEKRKTFTGNRVNQIWKDLDRYSKDYVELGLGSAENFEREVLSQLVLKWKEKYE